MQSLNQNFFCSILHNNYPNPRGKTEEDNEGRWEEAFRVKAGENSSESIIKVQQDGVILNHCPSLVWDQSCSDTVS